MIAEPTSSTPGDGRRPDEAPTATNFWTDEEWPALAVNPRELHRPTNRSIDPPRSRTGMHILTEEDLTGGST